MSTSGRQNQQKKLKKEEVGDRLSSLSDEFLHKILSLMNTKYEVQTCVLSKRWKYLWKSLPYLDFNHKTFPFKGGRYEGQEEEPDIISLNNFITQVLFRRHHHTDLVKVCFQSYDTEPYVSIVQGLIAYAVDHNVQQLTIESDDNIYWGFVMPHSFYTCKSLRALKLVDVRRDTMKFPKFLDLPSLKSLHLDGFRMIEEYFNPGDFSGCPNLETLKLIGIYLVEDLFINAPNLKRLEVSFVLYKRGDECNGRKVMINAPRLVTFQYHANDPIMCSFEDLASIEDAYFDIYCRYPFGYTGYEIESAICFDAYRKYVLHCINTFQKFCQAKSITLSWQTVLALSLFPSVVDENRLPFSNLKYLKIELDKWQRCDKVDIPGCVLNFFLNSFTTLKLSV